MTHPKNHSIIALISHAMIRSAVWLLFSSVAGVFLAVLLVAFKGSDGFISLQQLIQSDYHAIATLASPTTL